MNRAQEVIKMCEQEFHKTMRMGFFDYQQLGLVKTMLARQGITAIQNGKILDVPLGDFNSDIFLASLIGHNIADYTVDYL